MLLCPQSKLNEYCRLPIYLVAENKQAGQDLGLFCCLVRFEEVQDWGPSCQVG